jgi:hypothetical protein
MSGCRSPRTITLYDQPPTLRGRVVTPILPSWPAKDPTQTDFFTVDFGPNLCGRVIGSVLSDATAGVEIVGYTVNGSLVTFVMRGGTDGQTAQVQMRAICGQTDIPAVVLLPIVAQITLTLGEPEMLWTRPVVCVGTSPSGTEAMPIYAVAGATVTVRGIAVLRNPATGDSASFDFAADITGYGTPGAAVLQQGDPVYRADSPLAGCSVVVNAAGADISMIVTGVAGVTLLGTVSANWAAA